jgi:hypothetical protein
MYRVFVGTGKQHETGLAKAPAHPSKTLKDMHQHHAKETWQVAHLTSLNRLRLSSPVASRKSLTASTQLPTAGPAPGTQLPPAEVPLVCGLCCLEPLAAWLSVCKRERGQATSSPVQDRYGRTEAKTAVCQQGPCYPSPTERDSLPAQCAPGSGCGGRWRAPTWSRSVPGRMPAGDVLPQRHQPTAQRRASC